MKLYSYVVKWDTGFASNPFWGCCTLATCKPRIRRVATEGDWIAGTGSAKNVGNGRLIYAIKITEVMTLEHYGADRRFARKIPSLGKMEEKGDNIYYEDNKGVIMQRFPSMHSYFDRENLKKKQHDLNGKNVLISDTGNFYYFGREAPKIPKSLECVVKKGPGHKCEFPKAILDSFLRWVQEMKAGLNAYPWDY